MTRTGQTDPHSGKPIVLQLPSGPIAALRAGVDGDPDVLLVPGYTGSKEDFVPILDLVADAGFRVTSIDLPGQYESPGPDDPAAYTPDALARTLIEIADELDAAPHLLGHSFGGLVARAAVLAAPHRFADLVLMSSGPGAIGGLRRQRVEELRPLLPEAGLTGVWAAMQAAYLAEPGYVPPPPDLGDFLERRFLQGNPAMLHGMGDAISADPDRVDALRATGVRVLVLYGEADNAWLPAEQAQMAQRLGVHQVVIPHAAHSPAAENPQPTARALLDFWQAS